MMQREIPRLEIFSGWKEIANYLGKGVRTVQRYERDCGLPIRRPSGSRSTVALKVELDEWFSTPRSRVPSATKRRALRSRTNKLRADFLQVDSEIALTFASMALGTTDQEKRRRTGQIARKAYDTIMQMRENTDLSAAENEKLDAKLRRLKNELQTMGQKF